MSYIDDFIHKVIETKVKSTDCEAHWITQYDGVRVVEEYSKTVVSVSVD